jgi:hypothetical protein
MRIFLVLLLFTATLVAALLIGSAVQSAWCARLLGRWRLAAWLVLLAVPAWVVHVYSLRYQQAMARLPPDWADLRLAEITLLRYFPAAYALGFLIGGFPHRRPRTDPSAPEDPVTAAAPAATAAGEGGPADEPAAAGPGEGA